MANSNKAELQTLRVEPEESQESQSQLVVLSRQNVAQLLDRIPHSSLVYASAKVFKALVDNQVECPERSTLSCPEHDLLVMPAQLKWCEQSIASVKTVSVPRRATGIGCPASTLLFDDRTGRLKSIVNAELLTAVRTAAGSALATLILATPNAETVLIFGTGLQAEWHARLITPIFPMLTTMAFVGRSVTDAKRSQYLINTIRSLYEHSPGRDVSKLTVQVFQLEALKTTNLVQKADVICTCTPSREPLFAMDELSANKPVHINAIGSYKPSMMEFDLSLLHQKGQQSQPNNLKGPSLGPVIVDSKASCINEAGEIISLLDGNSELDWSDIRELGELLNVPENTHSVTYDWQTMDQIRKRTPKLNGNVTVFKSVGVGVQDTMIAEQVHKLAVETQPPIGQRVYF